MEKVSIRAAGAASVFAALSLASVQARAAEHPGLEPCRDRGFGHCTVLPCIVGGTLTNDDVHGEYGDKLNASATSSSADWGLAHASANPGVGEIALPQLHSDVSGASFHSGAFSWNYSVVHGADEFTWTGAAVDLPVSAFIATLNYTIGGTGFGQVEAALAISTSARLAKMRWAKLLVQKQRGFGGGFLNTCASEGAIAVGDSGVNQRPWRRIL